MRLSLRWRVILITGLALALLWAAAAAWMMRGVQDTLTHTLDGRLAMSARMVAGLLERAAIAPDSQTKDFSEAVRIAGGDDIVCEVRAMHSAALSAGPEAAAGMFDDLPPGLSTQWIDGHAWRVYVLHRNGYRVATADRLVQRRSLAEDMLRAAGIPFVIAMLGGLVALGLGIRHGLAPLQTLSQQLRSRQPDDTRAVTLPQAPSELRPVVDALNGMLERLSQALAQQRAFTDAAAHELRTPLTIIDTHLQVLRLTSPAPVNPSLASAEAGVQRLRHTLTQMMTLARSEAAQAPASAPEPLGELLQRLILDWPATARQRICLNMPAAARDCLVPGAMLGTALRNLIDNALRYAPADTPVHIEAQRTAQRLTLIVQDQGPGLSATQWQHVGQRFWRAASGREARAGAGLGLSIVKAIAQRFDATLTLSPADGGGLRATLSWPLPDTTR